MDNDKKPQKMNRLFRLLLQGIVAFMIAVVLVTCNDLFFFTEVGVTGESMENTINASGSSVKIIQNGYTLERGDIIVFFRSRNEEEHPIDQNPATQGVSISEFFTRSGDVLGSIFHRGARDNGVITEINGYSIIIKRVIALGGDTVRIHNGHLYIKYAGTDTFVLQEEDYIKKPMATAQSGSVGSKIGVQNGEWYVAEGELFVLGDNRDISYDSEDYGPIHEYQVWGKVKVLVQDDERIVF